MRPLDLSGWVLRKGFVGGERGLEAASSLRSAVVRVEELEEEERRKRRKRIVMMAPNM